MSAHLPYYLNESILKDLCQRAITEDVGSGDATTLAVVPAQQTTVAHFIPRQQCVVAGLPILEILFRELSSDVEFTQHFQDGEIANPGDRIATVEGNALAILTGERTALNILQHLSGIATVTRKYVEALGHDTNTKLLDTRKTKPGLRLVEKYAVLMGGAQNHRIGLYDRIMIKDNHRELAGLGGTGGILRSVANARKLYPDLEVEVEIDSLAELPEALESKAEYILLDNMSTADMAEAVRMTAHRAKLEASGNMTLARIPEVAATGVDFISSGALTHSVKSADISMDIVEPEK